MSQTAEALRQVSGRMVEAADFLERGPAPLEPVYAQRLRARCGLLDELLAELWEHLAPGPGVLRLESDLADTPAVAALPPDTP